MEGTCRDTARQDWGTATRGERWLRKTQQQLHQIQSQILSGALGDSLQRPLRRQDLLRTPPWGAQWAGLQARVSESPGVLLGTQVPKGGALSMDLLSTSLSRVALCPCAWEAVCSSLGLSFPRDRALCPTRAQEAHGPRLGFPAQRAVVPAFKASSGVWSLGPRGGCRAAPLCQGPRRADSLVGRDRPRVVLESEPWR